MPTSRRFVVNSPRTAGIAIREARRQLGITQADLAARVGIDRTYLSGLERGDDDIRLRRLFDVFANLGIVLDANIRADDGKA